MKTDTVHFTRSIEKRDPWDAVLFRILWSKGSHELDNDCYRREPPLVYALRQGNVEAARLLLALDPAMAASNELRGFSPLHAAAENNLTEVLGELLKVPGGLDVNVLSEIGRTPLHCASDRGCMPTVEKLLELGAKVNLVDENGDTPLYLAAWNTQVETVKYLLKKDADPNIGNKLDLTPLLESCDSAEIQDALLSYGARVDYAMGSDGWTALMRSAYWENEACLETLVRHRASVNLANKL